MQVSTIMEMVIENNDGTRLALMLTSREIVFPSLKTKEKENLRDPTMIQSIIEKRSWMFVKNLHRFSSRVFWTTKWWCLGQICPINFATYTQCLAKTKPPHSLRYCQILALQRLHNERSFYQHGYIHNLGCKSRKIFKQHQCLKCLEMVGEITGGEHFSSNMGSWSTMVTKTTSANSTLIEQRSSDILNSA